MELSGVYVFGRDDVDIDTTGLVGDLQPISCVFTEEKNGDSSLEMRLCYDGLNKWEAVKPGRYIKAKVPVRVPPRIVSSAYTTEVTTYRVKTTITRTATVYQSTGKVIHQAGVGNQGRPRPEPLAISRVSYALDIDGKLETIQKPVQVKYRLNPGAEVQLLSEDGEKAKIYAPSFGTGWTLMSNLEAVKTTQILGTFNGVEAVTDAVRLQYQLFQVTGVEQGLEGIDVTAQHVFYELLTNYTTYKTDSEAYCADAINGVFGGMTTPDERFTCLTDCKDKAGPMDYDRVNVVQALLDPESGICARYGLSLVRNNYDLYALKHVGSDRGFVVEYGKNMLDVNRTENISNVVTRIIPYGKTKKGDIVYLDGTAYVDSPHIGDYVTPRTMYLDCSDTAKESKDMTLAQVKEELKRRAQAEFDAGCDLPELSMTVDFLSLGDTEEYKQYRDLDKVFLFDKITVRDRVRGYDYNAEVVAITHNVLTGMLESVTLGSIDKGSGIRKIPTWQVPEVDGSNIRLASIAAGALAGGAVNDDNLQDDSVTTRAIRAQSVTTEKLAAGSITADKIEAGSVTTEKLAAGAVTADTVAAGAISTEKLQAGAVNADKLAANAVTAGKIAAGAVVASKIDASAVTADKIAAGAVSAGKIAAGAVTTDKLAAGAVNADKLAANSVTAGKIAAGAVTAGNIAAHAVTTEKIATGAITAESGIIAESAIGTSQIADASITDAKIVGLTANKLTAGTIDASKIAVVNLVADNITTGTINGQVIPVLGGDKLAAGAVTGEKIAKNAVTADKIVAGAVTTDKLAANAVTANKILAGAVTADKLSASAVTADKIASGAITTNKLSSDVGANLDLSSNKSINLMVSGIETDIGDIEERVTDAETAISQNAGEIALRATKSEVSTAKSEAISAAATDATTKANNAKSAAISAAATDATTKANNAKSAAISAAATDATTKSNNALAAAKTYADAQIQISADAIKSTVEAEYTKKIYHSAVGTAGTAGYVAFAELTVTGNYANRPVLFGLANRGRLESSVSVRFNNINTADPTLSGIYETGGINTWIEKTATSKWRVIAQKSEGYDTIYVNDFTNNNSNIAVAWINVQLNAVPSGATASTKLVGSQAISTIATKSEVTQTANGIRSEVSAELGNYSTTAQMNSAIDQRANSITQTVSETYTTKTDFNNLQIGGTNYVLNSSFLGRSNDGIYTFSGDEVTFSASSTGIQSGVYFNLLASNDFCKPARNNKVTLSIEYKIESTLTNGTTNPWCGAQLSVVRDSTTGGSTQWLSNTVNETAISNRWLKRSATFTITDYDIASANINIYFRDIKGTIKFRHPKLEIGNKATDWSPAPEDAGTRIGSLETRVTQTESQWSVTAEKVDGMRTGGQNLLKKHKYALGQSCAYAQRGTWFQYSADWMKPLFSADYGFYRAATSGNGVTIGSITDIHLKTWTDYTLSFGAFCETPSGNYTETQDIYARVFKTTEYSERIEKKLTVTAGFVRLSYTFNTGNTVFDGGVDFISWESGSTQSLKYGVYIGDIMLVEGKVPAAWSPNEWDGAKTTTVTVDHTGMYVNTEGVVEFNTNKFSVSPPDGNDQLFSVSASDHTVRAQRGYFDRYLHAPNMATRHPSKSVYVDIGGPGQFSSIQAAWDSLPDVCGTVFFRLHGNVAGSAILQGNHVSDLFIQSGDTTRYTVGNLELRGISCFTIQSVTLSRDDGEWDFALAVYGGNGRCFNTTISASGRGVLTCYGANLFLYSSEITGIGSYTQPRHTSITVLNSICGICNCSGGGTTVGVSVSDGGLAILRGTIPGASVNRGTGYILGTLNTDYTMSGATPTPPAVIKSSTFSASTCVTWQSTYGSTWKKITSSVGTKVESRHSTTSSGFDYRAGWWVLDTGTAIKTALSGKTISKATVTIRRNDTNSDARVCHLCYHSMVDTKMNGYDGSASGIGSITGYGIMTQIGTYTLAASTETVITLPSSVYAKLKDGTIRGFGLVDNSTDYRQIMCDNSCTLTVTYT